jgi:Arc-like DNA binding domain
MARKRKLADTVALQVRMPEALRQRLAAEAEKANRSLNSEVLWRLGQTFGDEWQRFIAGVEEREKREKELREQLYQDPAYKDFVERRMAELMEKDPDLRKDK